MPRSAGSQEPAGHVVGRLARPGPWTLLAVALLGTFLGGFNNSVASVTLPAVLESFPSTSVAAGTWLLTGFIYTTAVMVPLAGWAQDRSGARPLYLGGLLLCAAASLLCALAPSFWWLIAGRVLQGVVLAAVLPTVFITITSAFEPARRGRALGVWASVNGVSLTAGPLIGGAIIAAVGWRAVFLVDVALSLLAFAAAYCLLPNFGGGGSGRLDLLGAGLFIGALLSILLTLSSAASLGVASWQTIACAATFVVVAGAAALRSLRITEPFPDLRLFRRAPFSVLNAVAALQMVALFGLFLVVPLLLVSLHGSSDAHVGLLLALAPLVATLLAPLAGGLADRVGTRLPLVLGGAFLGAAGVVLAAAVGQPDVTLVVGLVLAGLGIGFIQSPAAAEVTRTVDAQQAGVAAGIFNASRLLAGAAGAAAFTVLFQFAAEIPPGGTLAHAGSDALESGFHAVFVGIAVVGAVVLALALGFGSRFGARAPAGRG
jgi:EmrB/QacA subfamily drug resistance transporter